MGLNVLFNEECIFVDLDITGFLRVLTERQTGFFLMMFVLFQRKLIILFHSLSKSGYKNGFEWVIFRDEIISEASEIVVVAHQ